MATEKEILNIEYHTRILVKEALRRYGSARTASKYLKVSDRTVFRYMNKFNKGEIQKIKTISGQVYRVVLGPFSSIDSANKTVKMVKSSGHDALILINK